MKKNVKKIKSFVLSFFVEKYKKSASLLEMSVVLAIVGVSVATAIPAISYIKSFTPKMADEIKIKNIKSALKEYFIIHNRLPKPAPINLTRNDTNYGEEKIAPDTMDLSFDSDFHTITHETVFLSKNTNPSVPATYQQLEYIEATGTQYIDTGFKPNSDTKLEFKINFQGSGHFLAYDKNNRYGFYYDGNNFRYDRQTLATTIGAFNAGVDWYIEEYKGVKIGTSPNSLTTYATDTTSFSVNQNFCLFAMCYNTDNNPSWFSKAKLYYFRMYNNGTLIRDFIPCYRISDGVIGMYDVVGKIFYTNKGTGSFVKGPANTKINVKYIMHRGIVPFKELGLQEQDVVDNAGNFFEYYVPEIMTLKNGASPTDFYNAKAFYKTGYSKKVNETSSDEDQTSYPCISQKDSHPKNLCEKSEFEHFGVKFTENNHTIDVPNEYEPVNYIGGTGTQTIDLGYKPTTATRIQFKYVYERCLGGVFIGYHVGSDETDYRFFCAANDNTYFDGGANESRIQTSYITSNTKIYETEIYNYGIKNLIDNSVVATSTGTVNVSANSNLQLFRLNSDYGKIYYIKIYETNTLKRNYIPCYRKSDGVAGLYETVEKKFYTNSGTGTFIIGDNTAPDISYTQPPYGLRVRDVELENQSAKYDSSKGVYVPNPLEAYVDNNGDIAYVLVSHGENGDKTCGIRKPKVNNVAPNMISTLTNCAKIGQDSNDIVIDTTLNTCSNTSTSKYEAQNCFNVEENSAFDLIGREKFLNGKNHELTFYQGKKSQSFDDIVEYETLANLLANGKNEASY